MTIDGGLRKLFRDWMPEAQWTSIETGGTSLGVPDCEYCFPHNRQGWVEFKVTAANAVTVHPEQVAWAERRVRQGGRIFLAVRQQCRSGPRRKAKDALFLYRGIQTRAVRMNGLLTLPMASWEGGPGHWDWGAIRTFLCREE